MNAKTLGIGLLAAVLIVCSITMVNDSTEAVDSPSITDIDYSSDTGVAVIGFNADFARYSVFIYDGTDAKGQNTNVYTSPTNVPIRDNILEPGDYTVTMYRGTDLNDVYVSSSFHVWTVQFDANNGNGNAPEAVYATGTYVLPDGQGLTGPDGEEFLGWSETKDGEPVGKEYEVTKDVVLYAVYGTSHVTEKHQVTVEVNDNAMGSATANVSEAAAGETVTLDIKPNDDFKVKSVTVNGQPIEDDAGTYSFEMPDQDAKVVVTFVEDVQQVPVTDVTLNQESLEMTVGEEQTLTATVVPEGATDKSVRWSSSDDSVATVDENGKVIAKKAGTTMITATAGGVESEPFEITVTEAVVPVTGVTLDQKSLEMTVGDEQTLTATVEPGDATNQSVRWSSSDDKVVTVENGKVRAVGVGNATITVTTEDGDHTATCEVTVNPVPVTEVTLDKTNVTLYVGDSQTLIATVSPENATNQSVRWSSSDDKVVTVDNGKVRAVGVGTATITVMTEDGDYTATCQVTVEEKEQPVPGIDIKFDVGAGGNANRTIVDNGDGTVTVIVTVDPYFGYSEHVTSTPYHAYEIVNGNYVFRDVAEDITIEVTFTLIDDDDEEYIPPVVVPKGDDDTTTYIVAIAAAAVVAILAALILMQSRKS